MTKATAFKLMLFDFSRRKWTEVFGFQMTYPSWSHDMKYIYFQSWHDPVKHSGERLVKLRLSDGNAETSAISTVWDDSPPEQLWPGLDLRRTTLLCSLAISTSELFAFDVEWP
jgi:hypothetical protein